MRLDTPFTCFPIGETSRKPLCVGISPILLFCDLAYTLWWCVFCFVWFLSAMKEWSTEAIEKIATRLHTVWIFSAIPMFYILMSNNININYLSGFCEVKTPTLVLFQLFFMLLSCALAILMLIALRNVRNTPTFSWILIISIGKSVLFFYALWVYSPKTFQAWNDLICFCKSSNRNRNQSKTQGHQIFSNALSKVSKNQ
ncbi:hypothetical protein NQ317_016083 [Molorchus minor]|uniref:Frizzled/Smoothened 7TM domain-containing protein n=1 Tax=Molorchus minor TaxID=1323400 RepID=A0ABQ9IT82_9CUCU|nr:hypothetical protein NQ317_016083 [Molorchus minor]